MGIYSMWSRFTFLQLALFFVATKLYFGFWFSVLNYVLYASAESKHIQAWQSWIQTRDRVRFKHCIAWLEKCVKGRGSVLWHQRDGGGFRGKESWIQTGSLVRCEPWRLKILTLIVEMFHRGWMAVLEETRPWKTSLDIWIDTPTCKNTSMHMQLITII